MSDNNTVQVTDIYDNLEKEAHIWYCFTEKLADDDIVAFRAELDQEERARCERITDEQTQRDFIAAHGIKRQILSKYLRLKPSDWRFEKTDNGKPYIKGLKGEQPLQFNLTHTKGCIAIVISEESCGIDVEDVTRSVDALELARRTFADQEIKDCEQLTGDQLICHFFRLWTLREAYIKAIGGVIAGSSEHFYFVAGDQDTFHLYENYGDLANFKENRDIAIRNTMLDDKFMLSVVTRLSRSDGYDITLKEYSTSIET